MMKKMMAAAVLMAACLPALPVFGLAGGPPLSGQVTTFAGGNHHGHGDDFATQASFDGPRGLAANAQGDLYVADYFNACIRFIARDGSVRTVAGGEAGFADGRNNAARFRYPTGLAVDSTGGLIVADTGNHRIRRVDYDHFQRIAVVTTLAGSKQGIDDGRGSGAEFNGPQGVTVDRQGTVYVADTGNHRIRRILPDGTTTTLAGGPLGFVDGGGAQAGFARPEGIAVDRQGALYVADTLNHAIRRVAPDGMVTTVAGDGRPGLVDGVGRAARFQEPAAVAVDGNGILYVADTGNSAIRRVQPDGTVSTLAGGHPGFADGFQHGAAFARPRGIAALEGSMLFVADTDNNRIRRID
jgi:sugar lactone lactonase YvrE